MSATQSPRTPASPGSRGRFDVIADVAMAPLLARFYLGLAFDGRRGRFRGGISDESIRRHCGSLDARVCFAVGLMEGADLRAVLEAHSLDRTFESAELTACCRPEVECRHVVAHLVQIAAFEAARRGCGRLVVDQDDGSTVLLEMLREMGTREPDGPTTFDIREYAVAAGPAFPRNVSEIPAVSCKPASGAGRSPLLDVVVSQRTLPP